MRLSFFCILTYFSVDFLDFNFDLRCLADELEELSIDVDTVFSDSVHRKLLVRIRI